MEISNIKIALAAWVCVAIVTADVQDKETFNKAAQAVRGATGKFKTFQKSWGLFQKNTKGKSIHPLLCFMGACIHSENEELGKLAVYIMESYKTNRDFIKNTFGFTWGTQSGNADEQSIYRIVGGVANHPPTSLVPSFSLVAGEMLKFKVFVGWKPMDITYHYKQIKSWNKFLETWPDYFTPEEWALINKSAASGSATQSAHQLTAQLPQQSLPHQVTTQAELTMSSLTGKDIKKIAQKYRAAEKGQHPEKADEVLNGLSDADVQRVLAMVETFDWQW